MYPRRSFSFVTTALMKLTNDPLPAEEHKKIMFHIKCLSNIPLPDEEYSLARAIHCFISNVGGSVLSVCREFLSNRRQRLVDGATCEWIPIVSGLPQGSVLGLLLFILYTSEMFELVENRLYAYSDYS